MNTKKQIREWIREIIVEEITAYLENVEEDIDEVSTSAGAGPYNTPFAFSGKDQTFRKKNAERDGMRLTGFDDLGHGKIDTESAPRKISKKNNQSKIVK